MLKPSLLILETEAATRESYRSALQNEFDLVFVEDLQNAIQTLQNRSIQIFFFEFPLEDFNGFDAIKQIKRKEDTPDLITIAATKSVDTALEALKRGASHCLLKPFKKEELYESAKLFLEFLNWEGEVRFKSATVDGSYPAVLLGDSEKAKELRGKLGIICKFDFPVLIHGEMGSGMEEIARAIHIQGLNPRGPFATISCTLFSRTQLEKELFGDEGDELKNKNLTLGKLQQAKGGTLFLSRINRMALETQDKLLRVITNRDSKKTSALIERDPDIRFIGSTDHHLGSKSETGAFRKELFKSLSAFSLGLAPLRDRKADIPSLISHFLKSANSHAKVPVKAIQREAIQFLTQYHWPGNIKELQAIIEMMVLTSGKETLGMEDIPLDLLIKQVNLAKTNKDRKVSLNFKKIRRHFERQFIRRILEQTKGNQTVTAATLGLHRNTLIWKMKGLNLKEEYEKIIEKRRKEARGNAIPYDLPPGILS